MKITSKVTSSLRALLYTPQFTSHVMALYKLQNFVKFRPKNTLCIREYLSIVIDHILRVAVSCGVEWRSLLRSNFMVTCRNLRHLLLDKSLSFVISSFPMFPEYSSQNWGKEYLLIEKLCEGALCVYLLEIISKKLSLLRHAKKKKNSVCKHFTLP